MFFKKQKKSNDNVKSDRVMDKEELFGTLISDYTTMKQDMIRKVRRGQITKEVFMEDTRNHIKRYADVPEEVAESILTQFEQYIFGYSRLTPLIDAKDISDIRCIGYENVRIKENGIRKNAEIRFGSKQEYANFVEFVATKNQVSISNLNAIQRFTDTESHPDFILRFTISMPLVNTYDEPYMAIRKVPKNFPEIEDLVKADMIPRKLAPELVERFRTGSTLICGGNSSGKTTILNALKESLPEKMSILIAQQADELTSKRHPDMMFLHSLPGTAESQISYDLEDISIAGLTMDVDFFIVGEIKGAEALYVLNAAYTGQICAATIHAPSAGQATDKAVDYSMQNSRYSKAELMKMMACFKNIIFMKDYKVNQLYEVTGWDDETQALKYNVVYERSTSDGIS
uniref:ATPase, T2SS/T4P/T4SS family n=1 Tax=Acetatifactor sp. TaxID=1872090 RepID=UPI004057233C